MTEEALLSSAPSPEQKPLDILELVRISQGSDNLIQQILWGGRTRRYHTHPYIPMQEVDAHTWRLISIMLTIWPDTDRDTIISAQFHDAPAEGVFGDLPAPFKWASPEVKEIYHRLEKMYMEITGLPQPQITRGNVARLKVSDYLELTDYCTEFGHLRASNVIAAGIQAVGAYAKLLEPADRPALLSYVHQQKPRWDERQYGPKAIWQANYKNLYDLGL